MKANEQRDWRLPAFGWYCPSQIDWARMAAYIDGEGSILINPRRGRIGSGSGKYSSLFSTFYLKVTVSNTDVRLLIWIEDTFGGSYKDTNSKNYYEGKNWKRSYHWSASSGRAAWILYNCLPYFVIKKEQAEIGIQLQGSVSKTKRGPGKRLPDDLVEERRELKHKLLVMKARGRVIESAQAERIKEIS